MTNEKWVDEQVKRAGLGPDIGHVLKKLLNVIDDSGLPNRVHDNIIEAFATLLRGHALETPPSDERWGPVLPGAYNIGDTVRVRTRAYEDSKGVEHNGKRGRVTAARNGFVVVLYEDAPSSEIQHYHSPEKLERLI